MKLNLFVLLGAAFILAFAVGAGGRGKSAAVENCIAWDNATHTAAGDSDPNFGRPAIDRLISGQPYGQILNAWVADNCMRLNEVQAVGTHNSYHIQPRPAILQAIRAFDPVLGPQIAATLEYTHRPLAEQLGILGIRQVELDVYADPTGGRYAVPLGPILVQGFPDPIKPAMLAPGLKVLHVPDVDFETTCLTFVTCLQDLKQWSNANPGHLPIMVEVEAKEGVDPNLPPGIPWTVPAPFNAAALDEIDADIHSVFSDADLITPDDVRGNRATLEEAVLKDGWPTLNETRGRFLFTLDNEDSKRDLYIAGHSSLQGRVLFTTSGTGSPESAFVKLNDPIPDFNHIQHLVSSGYVVRTRADQDTIAARLGLTAQRDTALASGAQWVSTDYPEPNPAFGTGYVVHIADDPNARCDPVLSPPGCDASTFEQ